jgi:drug/metabolite transporter (DMT)-like permease
MPLLLAGLASIVFGVADFVGGFVTRRAPAITVVWGSQLLSLGAVVALAPFFSDGIAAGSSLGWGAAAGAAGAFGLVIFYHALATTRVAVVASVAAVVGTAAPVLFGVVIGERPAPVAWAGMALAIPALLLLPSGERDSGRADRAVWLGIITGVCFALFGIMISRTGSESGLWPLAWARMASVVLLTVTALATGRPLLAPRPTWRFVAAAGLFDMAGNVLFLLAVRRELLSLVAVIMSLYPVSTIALARLVFGERVARRQIAGLGVAALAVALIAAG